MCVHCVNLLPATEKKRVLDGYKYEHLYAKQFLESYRIAKNEWQSVNEQNERTNKRRNENKAEEAAAASMVLATI